MSWQVEQLKRELRRVDGRVKALQKAIETQEYSRLDAVDRGLIIAQVKAFQTYAEIVRRILAREELKEKSHDA